MTAAIQLDLEQVRPVYKGRWHRLAARSLPEPGGKLRLLCGVEVAVEYQPLCTSGATITTCWGCDLAYCRQAGIDVPSNHPGLPTQAKS